MKKATALTLLGGNTNRVGRKVGCTGAAIRKWPDDLPDRLVDRVVAAIVRDLVIAARNRQLRKPERITLPVELYRHLLGHIEHLSGAVRPNEFTRRQPIVAGICTNEHSGNRHAAGSANPTSEG
jgi:hypothetical protein